MLITYQVQIHVDAPKEGDEDDKEYLHNCGLVEDAIQALPGYVAHDLEDESED